MKEENLYDKHWSHVCHLEKEEEFALMKKYQKSGDIEILHSVIKRNLPFIKYIALQYKFDDISMNDLIQEGYVAMIKSAQKFDVSRGIRLASFAVKGIRHAMLSFIIDNVKIMRLATTKPQKKLFCNLYKESKKGKYLSLDEIKSIAKKFNVKESEVTEMEKRINSGNLPYHGNFSENLNYNLSPEDILYNEDEIPENIVEKEKYSDFLLNQMWNAFKQLPEDHQYIVSNRWLKDDNKVTLRELSEKYGISIEAVRQREERAFKTMRELMTLDK